MSPVYSAAKKRIYLLTLSAVMSALVFIATALLPRIPFPGGYIHIGDALIYLTAALLPTPCACAAAAIGSGLADALTGYIIWAPGTIIIKILMALMFTSKDSRILSTRNMLAVIPAGVICIGGYYLYEAILTSSFAVPLASLYFNLIQSAASAAIFFLLGLVFRAADLKKRLRLG